MPLAGRRAAWGASVMRRWAHAGLRWTRGRPKPLPPASPPPPARVRLVPLRALLRRGAAAPAAAPGAPLGGRAGLPRRARGGRGRAAGRAAGTGRDHAAGGGRVSAAALPGPPGWAGAGTGVGSEHRVTPASRPTMRTSVRRSKGLAGDAYQPAGEPRSRARSATSWASVLGATRRAASPI